LEQKLNEAARVTRQLMATKDKLERETVEMRRQRAIDADLMARQMSRLSVKAAAMEKQRQFEADEYLP
jgi:hypothetical protein